jgi:pyrophosphatase PpaX
MTDPPEERFVIEAVLFDLDGTLIDTIALILASMRHATTTVLGREYSDDELLCGVGTPLVYQMRELSATHADELMSAYREHNWEHHDALIEEYPGVDAMLEGVAARHIPMGIVTSKSRPVAERGLELLGLGDHFEVVVCAEDTERHKPEPDPLIHAATAIGADRATCIYVGDSPFDMRAAKAAGVVPVAAMWGAFPAEAVLEPQPTFAISHPDELVELMSGEAGQFRVTG